MSTEVPGHTVPLAPGEEWIGRVDRNADEEWKRVAGEVVRQVAVLREKFTTDAVWYILERDHPSKATHEPRAMGAIMRTAVRHGWVRATAGYTRSARPACHSRPVRVWESLIYPGRS